ISLNPADDEGVVPHLRDAERLHRLKPFLDSAHFSAARTRPAQRLALAQRFGLRSDSPWLVTVAMMRAGDKLASYTVLGEALTTLTGRAWQLLVVGDGPARRQVEQAFAGIGARVVYAG